MCKGDSLCTVLSNQMPRNSVFHLSGSMYNGVLKLTAPINYEITLSKSIQLEDAYVQVEVVKSVQISIHAKMKIKGVDLEFEGNDHVIIS